MVALEDDRPGVREKALDQLTGYGSQAPKPLIQQNTIQKIGNLLKDDKQDSNARSRSTMRQHLSVKSSRSNA